ncbi:hypothetical protein BC829DRAFT_274154 [Chytridium lagenaria]|nr:hypothetical protein BC829DRAFT_274154 [Chytridium lagenaria]
MAGIDQLANPLRPRQGKYKVYELRHIFRTAFTAFSGAVRKTRGDDKFLTSKPEKPKNVTIHTGDWGCEEFGGNRTVMAYLQIAAARAGVTRLCYHTMKPEEEIWEALDLLNRKWPRSGSVKVEEGLLKAIEGLEKEWKKMEFRK